MRVAVAGGTGLVGRPLVAALADGGDEPIVLARAAGVDLTIGAGLGERLRGVAAVVDVTNGPAPTAAEAEALFGGMTARLLAAEQAAGVRHHVLLSICAVDKVGPVPHYAGKRRQEALVEAGPIPFTIVRATQFHDFAAMVVGWNRRGDEALVPPLLVQPVAVADVVAVLREVATGAPQGRTFELAGPETQDLVDMARRTLAARGESVRLVPSWRGGALGVAAAGEVMLPGPGARLGPTTFDAWLATQRRG